MSKHTPGPWVYSNMPYTDGTPYCKISAGDGIGYPGGIGMSGIISEADARLIAAAPTLLGLLKRWSALDAGAWHVERHAQEKAELIEATRAAIAQAEGDEK